MKSSIENHSCKLCPLHAQARNVCMKGWTGSDPRLLIFVDSPNVSEDRSGKSGTGESQELIRWMLQRMSVSLDKVAMSYTLRCIRAKQLTKKAERIAAIESCWKYNLATIASLRPKAVVVMGQVSVECFLGTSEVGAREGTKWTADPPVRKVGVEEVWVTYSPAYALEQPAETYRIYRVLWKAAEEAGLKPKTNNKLKPFEFTLK